MIVKDWLPSCFVAKETHKLIGQGFSKALPTSLLWIKK